VGVLSQGTQTASDKGEHVLGIKVQYCGYMLINLIMMIIAHQTETFYARIYTIIVN
jgi:hypothetical protein